MGRIVRKICYTRISRLQVEIWVSRETMRLAANHRQELLLSQPIRTKSTAKGSICYWTGDNAVYAILSGTFIQWRASRHAHTIGGLQVARRIKFRPDVALGQDVSHFRAYRLARNSPAKVGFIDLVWDWAFRLWLRRANSPWWLHVTL